MDACNSDSALSAAMYVTTAVFGVALFVMGFFTGRQQMKSEIGKRLQSQEVFNALFQEALKGESKK